MDSIWEDDDPKPERVKVKLTKEIYLARLRRRLPLYLLAFVALGVTIRLLRLQGHPWDTGFVMHGVWSGIIFGTAAGLTSALFQGGRRR